MPKTGVFTRTITTRYGLWTTRYESSTMRYRHTHSDHRLGEYSYVACQIV